MSHKVKSKPKRKKSKESTGTGTLYLVVPRMFKEGQSVEDVARRLSISTFVVEDIIRRALR